MGFDEVFEWDLDAEHPDVSCRFYAKHQDVSQSQPQKRLDNILADLKALFKEKFGKEISDDDDDDGSEIEEDSDGARWIQVAGKGGDGSAEQFAPPYLMKLASLEKNLVDVEAAYHKKYCGDVDADEIMTQDEKFDRLEHSLDDVNAMYEHMFGHNVDDLDEDAVCVTSGQTTFFETAYLERLRSLQATLYDVKTLYHRRFGSAVDKMDANAEVIHKEFDADCATWVLRSAKQSDGEEDQESRQKTKVKELERSLNNVKVLYEQNYGYTVDDKDVDEDGTLWVHFCGIAADTHEALYARMLDLLLQVMVLYTEKFGADVDDEVISGNMRYEVKVHMLENSLGGLKALYQQKYGYSVDRMDEDCAVWMSNGVPQSQDEYEQMLEGLQFKLSEVQSLCNEKYSFEKKAEALEQSVSDVKLLCKHKYGCSVDDVDDNGAPWIKSEETAEPQDACSRCCAGLESRLAEVKILYDDTYSPDEKVESLEESVNDVERLFEQKFGYSIADELDDDGALYRQIKHDLELEDYCHPDVTDLESMLADVKNLYDEKFTYKEKLQALEASVIDVKGIVEQKYACDGDDLNDAGVQWIRNAAEAAEAAAHPRKVNEDYACRLAGFEAKLGKIETLYSAKYGITDDGEEQDEVSAIWYQTTGQGL